MHADDASDDLEHGGTAGAPVFYPDIIETTSDTPLLLSNSLGVTDENLFQDHGLKIVRIDGISVEPVDAAGLPGIRIGEGEGAGFVFRRALDGQIVFVPDANYRGPATFTYTIADDNGDEATLVATVNVGPPGSDVAFSDGSHHAVVPEGTAPVIIGSLTINELLSDRRPAFQVFEGDTDTPSQQFSVLGDKLVSTQPLSHAIDRPLRLRVVAREDDQDIATGLLEVEVRARSFADTPSLQAAGPAPRLALVGDEHDGHGTSLPPAANEAFAQLLASLHGPDAPGPGTGPVQDHTLAAIEQALADLAARVGDDQFQFGSREDEPPAKTAPVQAPDARPAALSPLDNPEPPVPQPDPPDTFGF